MMLLHCALLAVFLAQEPPVLRQEIVVTAERDEQLIEKTTAAVTVLMREQIERAAAENLAELIGLAPGVHVLFPHPQSGVPMTLSRGFFGGGEVEYVRLLVDGIPTYDVESGIADWRAIRATEVQRVEIVRGPGSALWGDTALGGVIQVFTRKDETSRGRVGASIGSSESWSADLGYRGRFVNASATLAATDGYRDHSASQEVFASFSFVRDDWTVRVAASDRDRDEPGPLTLAAADRDPTTSDPLFEADREETQRLRASLSYEPAAGLRLTAYGSVRESDITRTLLILAGIGDRLSRELSTDTLGASVEAERGRFLFGVDAGRDSLDTAYSDLGSRLSDLGGTRVRAAGFVTTARELSPRFRITAGLRVDHLADEFQSESQSHTAWSPRIGINLEDRGTSAFLQVSRAFKAPTLDQLFDPRPIPDFSGGTFTISNPELSPQTADNLEIGLMRRAQRYRAEIVGYLTAVDDEIDFDPATFRYANIGSTLHSGVELDMSLSASERFSPRLLYTLTRVVPREGENQGNQLKNIPRHLLRAGASFSLPRDLSADVLASWIGERFLDDTNTIALDEATTIDLRLAKSLGRLRARLDLMNLTDEEYNEVGLVLPSLDGHLVPYVFPASGFSFRAGIDWKW